MQAEHVDAGELRYLLGDPGASLPGGDGPSVLLVDVEAGGHIDLEDATVARALGTAPAGLHAVVVGLADDDSAQPPWCDLVLGPAEHDELGRVVDTVAANPVASLTLVELLRVSGGMDIDAGLLAESASYGALQAGGEFARWRSGRPASTRRSTAPADRDDPPLLVRRDGSVLHLTLHRPSRRNALDVTLRDALVEQLHLVGSDPTIEQVVLDGTGTDFCSGGDLDEFGTADDASLAHLVRLERSIGRALARVAPRLTVRLHGACIGSGIELAAFASSVEVHGSASIGLPEVAMGLIPGAGGTVSLPSRIGRHRTCRLALTGTRLDGPTARDWGLVDSFHPVPTNT